MLKFNSRILKTAAALAFLASSGIAATLTPANALQSDHKRYASCKQLKSSGSVAWHGIASGTVEDIHSVFDGDRTFHTKACFSNQASCNTWVKRIWWEIPELDELRTAYCKPA